MAESQPQHGQYVTDSSSLDQYPTTDTLMGEHALSSKATQEIIDSDDQENDHITAQRFLAIIALAGTFTGSQIPGFLIGPSLNYIASDLHIGSERSWIVVAHSLASACIAPCAGYIQDSLGRRASLAVAMLLALTGAAVFGSSNGFPQAVAGSAITGIASAIQELTSVAAVSELVPARRRGLFLAVNTGLVLCFAPATLYTQLLSGGSDWRWLLWIDLIWNGIVAIILTLTYFRMKLDRLSRPSTALTWSRVDWVGIVLLTVSLTIFLVALQAGGQGHPWASAYVLCQLIIGAVGLIAFTVWEWKAYHCQPIVPFRIFRGQRVVGLALGIAIMGSVNYTSVLNLGPTIIQSVFNLSHITYGLIGLAPGFCLAFGAISVNILLSVAGSHAREIFATVAIITTAFTGAQAIITPSTVALSTVLTSIAAFGIGALLLPIATLVSLACPQDLIGTSVALVSTIRTMGGSIGYVILYNIFISQSGSHIPQEMAPRLIDAGLPREDVPAFIKQYVTAVSGGNLQDVPQANATVLEAAREGFQWGTADAAQIVFYASIPFGVVAIVLALFLPNMGKYLTNRVLAKSRKSA